jgi:hypothetical protein
MTPQEFKIKYPQYSDLEGDALWDMMTEMLLQSDTVLHADPNQEKVYHEPFKMNILQDDGVYREMTFQVEDDSTTRWLNNKGEEVKVKQDIIPDKQTTSYKMEIIDFSKL